jgi:hypothetical protein
VRFPWQRKPAEAIAPAQKAEIVRVFGAALQSAPKKPRRSPYAQELQPYEPFPGVVPMAEKRRAMAQDATPYSTINSVYGATDLFFPGYQVLAEMAQLPEYRKLSEIIAKEMTRKWIKLTTSGDEDKSDKIAALDAELKQNTRREKKADQERTCPAPKEDKEIAILCQEAGISPKATKGKHIRSHFQFGLNFEENVWHEEKSAKSCS